MAARKKPPAPRKEAAKLPAYEYEYKEPFRSEYGGGKRIGPMAQDMEQNPLYEQSVFEGPDGMKRVDTRQAEMGTIAAVSDIARAMELQEERLADLEALVAAKRKSKKSGKRKNSK